MRNCMVSNFASITPEPGIGSYDSGSGSRSSSSMAGMRPAPPITPLAHAFNGADANSISGIARRLSSRTAAWPCSRTCTSIARVAIKGWALLTQASGLPVQLRDHRLTGNVCNKTIGCCTAMARNSFR
ncbi:hypothetical protein D3C76_644920 [compost metagenome]